MFITYQKPLIHTRSFYGIPYSILYTISSDTMFLTQCSL